MNAKEAVAVVATALLLFMGVSGTIGTISVAGSAIGTTDTLSSTLLFSDDVGYCCTHKDNNNRHNNKICHTASSSLYMDVLL